MKRAINILGDVAQVATIQELTTIFESIASIRIAQTKDKVARSTLYFNELWNIYMQLRTNPEDRITAQESLGKKKERVCVVITSEGGLSGDIDPRVINKMSRELPKGTDIIGIGSHGASQLRQRRLPIVQTFPLPEDKNNEIPTVTPIVELIRQYQSATVYFGHYVSLGTQEVRKADLVQAIAALADDRPEEAEIIDSRHYIFEPDIKEVTAYMESVMLEIALGQFILESQLAQYASRFNAMSAAKQKAKELKDDYETMYRRAKRGESDNRLKEIINTLKASS
jgi:ATP synthase F1 gamma subunit